MDLANVIYIPPPYGSKGKLPIGSIPQRSGHTNFLYIYFNFSYYLGITPFRLSYDCIQNTFRIQAWFPQKVLCALIHIVVLARYFIEIRKTYQAIKPTNPIDFFRLIESSSSFLCKAVAFHNFWTKQEAFFRIVQFIEQSAFYEYNPAKIQSTFFISLLCTSFVAISITRLFLSSEIVQASSWDPIWWFRRLVAESRYSLFLSSASNETLAPDFQSISVVDTLISVVTAISIQFRLIVGFYLDLLVLFCVLSLWSPVAGFVSKVNASIEFKTSLEFQEPIFQSKDEQSTKPAVILDQYFVLHHFKSLKRLSKLVSAAIGGFLLLAISEILFGYAIDFEDVLFASSGMKRFVLILFYLSTCTTLFLSAEVCRKIYSIKTWLCMNEDELTISRNELMVILDDITNKEVCIDAGGRFIIDYSFLGTMTTLLVTFFIIRLQSDLMSPQN